MTLMFPFSLVQSLSHVQLFVTPWPVACQASLSISNSRSLLKLVSIESVMQSNHLILWCPLFLLPSIFPSIRVISNESVLHFRWPKYWSFSFSISLSSEYSGLISLEGLGGSPCTSRDSQESSPHHSSKASILQREYLGREDLLYIVLLCINTWFPVYYTSSVWGSKNNSNSN